MDFYRTREVKAALKKHICDECRHPIEIGHPYRQWSAMSDGDFMSGSVHPDCQDWANIVVDLDDWDNTRPFLCDADPSEQYGVKKIKDNPPSAQLFARLPGWWQETITALTTTQPAEAIGKDGAP